MRLLPKKLLDELLSLARILGSELPASSSAGGGLFGMLRTALATATHRTSDEAEFRDFAAQSLLCGLLAFRAGYSGARRSLWSAVAVHGGPVIGALLRECCAILDERPADRDTDSAPPVTQGRTLADRLDGAAEFAAANPDALLYVYEQLLERHSARTRTRRGVFYTPRPLARYVVSQVDRQLREEFHLADGLADTATWGEMRRRFPRLRSPSAIGDDEPFVRVLDPAAGTGVFLVEVISRVYATLRGKWVREAKSPLEIEERWNAYVPQHLLPRLWGVELLLPATLLATLQMADRLAATGYRFGAPGRFGIYLGDTLAGPTGPRMPCGLPDDWLEDIRQSSRARYEIPMTVVVGNPPFSAISQNRSDWIDGLLKGRGPDAAGRGYYDVDGMPLGERKLWLQDDYVKFMRYAQWQIERAGRGVVALVTNHGYLDNASFRGLRQRLVEDFPRLTILDLHGNRNKRETLGGGLSDENVFGIDSGVAVGMFRRPPELGDRDIRYGELWGTREGKLRDLARDRPRGSARPIAPTSPHHLLVPRESLDCDLFEQAFRLTEAMPVGSTAAVTARDHLVIAFEERELLERLQPFRDLAISDEEIRHRFFGRRSSTRYLLGDTRGWQLSAARRRMAEDAQWEHHVRPCLYRPFDRRFAYWADWMIDWPRRDAMRHLLAGDNLALVTRRQMLPTQECSFFWVADTIVIDGLIRSDNRGSESFFPLFLATERVEREPGSAEPRRANFAPAFVAAVERTTGLSWREGPAGDRHSTFGAEALFAYIYALFHSPTYRRNYAARLQVDFPRILLPASSGLLQDLAALGQRLIARHRDPTSAGESGLRLAPGDGRFSAADRKLGFPRYADGRILVNDQAQIEGVAPETWRFQVGGHQVCRKWLRDRRGRRLEKSDLDFYCGLVAAVQETVELMVRVDDAIERHGGWPGAFRLPGP